MEVGNFDLADPPPGFADDPFPWYAALQAHSPLDVAAWTGSSAPCKYGLARFNAMRLAKRFSPP